MVTLKTAKSQAIIFPSLGGVLGNLQLFDGQQSVEILDTYQSVDDLEAKSAYKSHFLLPFPNRLKNGQYTFDGKTYQFPVNDTRLGHSLHGFLDTIPMQIITSNNDDNSAVLELRGSFHGADYYPFPFEISTVFTLQHSEITVFVKIKNTGSSRMPIAFGWHPYLKINTTTIDDLKLQLPNSKLIELDERMMPTGKTTPFTTFEALTTISKYSFDNCFIIEEREDKRAAITLQSEANTLQVWQETTAFPYFQIYTPEHRQSIAIEPMTCNIDAFNNEEGLLILNSDEERQLEFGIKLT